MKKKTYFECATNPENPDDSNKIYVILDPSHMIKLVRNTIALYTVLYGNDNKKIEWKFFEELEKLSRTDDFRSFEYVHKLNRRHIQFEDRKMNVRLAVQTLSASVAAALEYLTKQNIPQFIDASPTARFIRIFDTLFDIMNAVRMRPNDNVFKSAMNSENQVRIFIFLEEALMYIKSLKITTLKSKKIVCILKSRARTGFLGFIVNIISISAMYKEFVEKMHFMRFLAIFFSIFLKICIRKFFESLIMNLK